MTRVPQINPGLYEAPKCSQNRDINIEGHLSQIDSVQLRMLTQSFAVPHLHVAVLVGGILCQRNVPRTWAEVQAVFTLSFLAFLGLDALFHISVNKFCY